MIKLCVKLPLSIAIAVSGGADSMAGLDFLRRSNRQILVLFYHHGGEDEDIACQVVVTYCDKYHIPYQIGRGSEVIPKGVSQEMFWRDSRYAWFAQATDLPVITCHHLDDVMETWVMSSMKGEGRLIPVTRDQYIRPFLTTDGSELKSWCQRKGVPYAEDPSNAKCDHDRNFVRNVMMSNVMTLNPGFRKTILKKVLETL